MAIDTFSLILQGLGIARSLMLMTWPILLLAPLRGRRPFAIGLYLANWLLLAMFWYGGYALPASVRDLFRFTLIPEPFNGLAFLASGLLIGMLASLARLKPRRRA